MHKYILFLFTLFIFSCSSPDKEIKKVVEEDKTDTQQEEVPFGLETSLEDSPATKYWYISYTVHRKSDNEEWKGYDVIKMNKSYFDIGLTIRTIYPSYINNEDYFGIDFFQEVPKETYIEYNKEQK